MTHSIPDVDTLVLEKGSHSCEEDGACFMEARALILGQVKTDDPPAGVSPLLHQFGLSLNDALADDRRQELKRFLPREGVDPLAGTAGDGRDEVRSFLATDWLIRTLTPAFVELRPALVALAADLRRLQPITDVASLQAAGPLVVTAHAAVQGARAAAWNAFAAAVTSGDRDASAVLAVGVAGTAVSSDLNVATHDAAWAAAEAATADTTAAAWAPVWDASELATELATRAAMRDAPGPLGDAVVDLAGEAAWGAAWAAHIAGSDALQPTLGRLQASAVELYAAMIRPANEGKAP